MRPLNFYVSSGHCLVVSRNPLVYTFILCETINFKVLLNPSTKWAVLDVTMCWIPALSKSAATFFSVKAPSSSVYRISGCLLIFSNALKIAGVPWIAFHSFKGITTANLKKRLSYSYQWDNLDLEIVCLCVCFFKPLGTRGKHGARHMNSSLRLPVGLFQHFS